MLAPAEQPAWAYAPYAGNEDVCRVLLAHVGAAALNEPAGDVETPLVLVLSNRRLLPIAPLLLSAGADPNLEGAAGVLPLGVLARMPPDAPERALVEPLLVAGARVGERESTPQRA